MNCLLAFSWLVVFLQAPIAAARPLFREPSANLKEAVVLDHRGATVTHMRTRLIRSYLFQVDTHEARTTSLAVAKSGETTWNCVGEGRNRSCLFKNLYYARTKAGKGDFFMFVSNSSQEMNNSVYRADKYEGPWSPRVHAFSGSKELEDHVASKPVIEQPGLSLLFNPLFHHNIGHALFDGLYPAYVSLVKLGLQDNKFRAVVSVAPDCYDPDAASPPMGLHAGDLLEAYLPHPVYNRTLRPVLVEVASVREHSGQASALESLQSACTFEAGLDSSATELDAKPVSPGNAGQAECCGMCGQTIGCTRGVIFANMCYLKGSCSGPHRDTSSCDHEAEERMMCRFNESRRPRVELVVRQTDSSEASGTGSKVEASIPMQWVVGKVRPRCMSEGIYKTFGKSGQILRTFEMDRDLLANPDVLYHFESIAVGSGSAGNLVADDTGAIGRSVAPADTMSRFRDRMLEAYRLPAGQGKRTHKKKKVLDVIVVGNKRFSTEDQAALKEVILASNLPGKFHAEIVNWHDIGTPEDRFLQHLKRVQQADVYVSSIGTALQYVPFMRDQTVYIALGSLWQRANRTFPTFMEQQLAGGGTPYLRTLYADPGDTLRRGSRYMLGEDGYRANINVTKLLSLFQEAEALVHQGFPLPVAIEDNLSRAGRVLVDLCKQDPETCQHMQADRNGARYECATMLWPECIVYEVGPWKDICNLNRPLLRKLRKKYNLFSYGAAEM